MSTEPPDFSDGDWGCTVFTFAVLIIGLILIFVFLG